jgi:hypothetical protein
MSEFKPRYSGMARARDPAKSQPYSDDVNLGGREKSPTVMMIQRWARLLRLLDQSPDDRVQANRRIRLEGVLQHDQVCLQN